jgi:carbon starvation protein
MPSIGVLGPVVNWTLVLLVYAFVASVLPVWQLLQPRDYINGHELFVALGLLALGVLFAHPQLVAPPLNLHPQGAPPLWPFLFITIACGAVSGFHSLVSSGTTAKQLNNENDARLIGYGGMLMEGMLAVFALIAVGGGIGLLPNAEGLMGIDAWNHHYAGWAGAAGLGAKVSAFVDGSANMLTAVGIPLIFGQTIMGVFVASFAGTTLDTATRLQRYAISELAESLNVRLLVNRYSATAVAVVCGGILALWDGKGAGGLLLWPLFGATNQLLASLALLVLTAWLAKQAKPLLYTLIPLVFMVLMTGWAMVIQLQTYLQNRTWYLLVLGGIICALEIWMLLEALIVTLKQRAGRTPATPGA